MGQTGRTTEISLAAGVEQWEHLPAGALLIARRGAVELRLPRQSLADTAFERPVRLAEGEACVLSRGGLVRLVAPRGGAVGCLLPEQGVAAGPRAMALLRALANRLRRPSAA